jgi:hypothetical protein
VARAAKIDWTMALLGDSDMVGSCGSGREP